MCAEIVGSFTAAASRGRQWLQPVTRPVRNTAQLYQPTPRTYINDILFTKMRKFQRALRFVRLRAILKQTIA